jgi:MinD-like ATPase involved in chromosome partitioning or flagellar assembly
MISQCVAERIAQENSRLNVLLIHAEQSGGTGYSPHVRESMERIRPYLAERLLDINDIIQRSGYRDNLSIIAGTDRPGSSELFHPDMAEFFLGSMAQSFDVVICDSGANMEHGLSLGALFGSDSIYMVFEQKENAFRHYEWLLPLYKKLGLNISGYVMNRFTANSAYTREYVKKRLRTSRDRLFTVRESDFGILAEIEEKSLLSYRDPGFTKDVDILAKDILMQTAGGSESMAADEIRAANG